MPQNPTNCLSPLIAGSRKSRRLLLGRRNKLPGFAYMNAERFVSDLIEPNSYPATCPEIRWFEVSLRRVVGDGLEVGPGHLLLQPYGLNEPAIPGDIPDRE